ncbi:ABC transporter type 1, transmembrane domain-containing protein [Blyttiomyces helicus]|uniref:ABC transporter type 1, transmembrane domain-containing protein n=1 Tax=Blyttiomyces helicus TaxID=388810 RepID=A0A4P9W7M3_9FUNG|nr:ABC transporter type 1, transmembrane domain-containing protein [Blyttiomyces helicus]|eukprot:RKO88481.1 ABC transporter type 1, transmembrane domain-containing protein [Blyttiomyces helicus]
MRLGHNRPLEETDLYAMKASDKADFLMQHMDEFWDAMAASLKDAKKPVPSLASVIRRQFFFTRVISGILQALSLACTLLVPVFVQQILNWILQYPQNPDAGDTPFLDSGVGLAFALFGLQLCATVFGRTSEQMTRKITVNMKTLLISLVFEKSLRLSAKASKEFDTGRIINMINVDAGIVSQVVRGSTLAWSAPVQIAASLALLSHFLGSSAVNADKTIIKGGDKRLTATREMLQGIRIVKLRAQENFFLEKLTRLRQIQVGALKRFFIDAGGFLSFTQIAPVARNYADPASYQLRRFWILQDRQCLFFCVCDKLFVSARGFTSVSRHRQFASQVLFGQLIDPMLALPNAITLMLDSSDFASDLLTCSFLSPAHLFSAIVMANISWKRIQSFLYSEESGPIPNEMDIPNPTGDVQPAAAISFKNATFSWPASPAEPDGSGKMTKSKKGIRGTPALSDSAASTINVEANTEPPSPKEGSNSSETQSEDLLFFKDLNFSIKKGCLTAIVGTVGAGKSSIFSAIIGEMTKVNGESSLSCVLPVLASPTILAFESGTFDMLRAANGVFAHMMIDHAFDDSPSKHASGPEVTIVDCEAIKETSSAVDIIIAEDKETGSVKWKAMHAYVQFAGGVWHVLLVLFAIRIYTATSVINQFWLSWWTSDKFNQSLDWYIHIYISLGVAQAVFLLIFICIIISGTYQVSRRMHRKALEGVLQAPMSFFDSQPVGRILNRFSKDIESIDQELWVSVFTVTLAVFAIFGNVVSITVVSVYMLGKKEIPLQKILTTPSCITRLAVSSTGVPVPHPTSAIFVPLAVIYYFILAFYRPTNRELK